jgi:hypothetical protein
MDRQQQTGSVMEADRDVEREPTAHEEDEILFCQWHPRVETRLRCYLCETPMCVKCARRTPVGYICPECQRGRRRRFENSGPLDYAIAGAAATVLGGVASILALLGAWWFLIFLSPLAGAAIAEVTWRLIGRRYGQHLWWIVGAGIIIGSLPVLVLYSGALIALLQGNFWGIARLLSWGLHVVLTVGSAIARLRMR